MIASVESGSDAMAAAGGFEEYTRSPAQGLGFRLWALALRCGTGTRARWWGQWRRRVPDDASRTAESEARRCVEGGTRARWRRDAPPRA